MRVLLADPTVMIESGGWEKGIHSSACQGTRLG
jgi:hypothetical protein